MRWWVCVSLLPFSVEIHCLRFANRDSSKVIGNVEVQGNVSMIDPLPCIRPESCVANRCGERFIFSQVCHGVVGSKTRFFKLFGLKLGIYYDESSLDTGPG